MSSDIYIIYMVDDNAGTVNVYWVVCRVQYHTRFAGS